jgi:hypothetical protein
VVEVRAQVLAQTLALAGGQLLSRALASSLAAAVPELAHVGLARVSRAEPIATGQRPTPLACLRGGAAARAVHRFAPLGMPLNLAVRKGNPPPRNRTLVPYSDGHDGAQVLYPCGKALVRMTSGQA